MEQNGLERATSEVSARQDLQTTKVSLKMHLLNEIRKIEGVAKKGEEGRW